MLYFVDDRLDFLDAVDYRVGQAADFRRDDVEVLARLAGNWQPQVRH